MSAVKNTSLFIPHVFPNFNQNYVAESFDNIGDVDRVDFVAKQDRDGNPYNAAYVHFKLMYETKDYLDLLDDIDRYGSHRFYHDRSQYYWIVLPNTAKKHIPGDRKLRINIGEANSISVRTPEQTRPIAPCLNAPKKPTYASTVSKSVGVKLEAVFDSEANDFDASEEAAQMDEIEAEIQAEEANLVSIDWRYIRAIEDENMWLNNEVSQLKKALINLDKIYQAEVAKVRELTNK